MSENCRWGDFMTHKCCR